MDHRRGEPVRQGDIIGILRCPSGKLRINRLDLRRAARIRGCLLEAALVTLLSLAEFTVTEIRRGTHPGAAILHLAKYQVTYTAAHTPHHHILRYFCHCDPPYFPYSHFAITADGHMVAISWVYSGYIPPILYIRCLYAVAMNFGAM